MRCFPSSDDQFQAYVQQVIADSWPRSSTSEDLLGDVRAKLVGRYPLATIQPRNALAELVTDDFPTWYVYRDGRAA